MKNKHYFPFIKSSVTINKTSDLDNNTDTLKKLTSADKPNNQSKLASTGGTPLPPSQIKCNILKGKQKRSYSTHENE